MGASAGGYEVRRISLAGSEVMFLRSKQDWETGAPAPFVQECQETIAWADHLVVVYPLWLGAMPAMLKAFFEQVFRPGFAVPAGKCTRGAGLLRGKPARIVVTMAMPAFIYRFYFLSHSLRSFKRNILRFVGIGPTRRTLIGRVEESASARQRGLDRMRALGTAGSSVVPSPCWRLRGFRHRGSRRTGRAMM